MARYKKQADGRYRTKVKLGVDSRGQDVYKYTSGRTIRELLDNIDELKRNYMAGGVQLKQETLFEKFVWDWYHAFKEPHIVPGVRQSYESAFNAHIIPALGDKQIGAITATDLQRLITSLSDTPYVCESVHLYLNQIFRHATAQRYIEYNPALVLTRPPRPGTGRRSLTADETEAALYVGKNHPDGIMLLLLYYLGVRRGEMLGLKWGDFDFKKRAVTISRDLDFKSKRSDDRLKTPAAYRTIPLPDALLTALRPLKGLPDVFVLRGEESGSCLSESTYQRKWCRLMIAMYQHKKNIEAKRSDPKDPESPLRSILTAHYFRHNYASVLYNADVDVLSAQKWLGHANVATTLKIYAHLGKGKEDRNVAKLRAAFVNQK